MYSYELLTKSCFVPFVLYITLLNTIKERTILDYMQRRSESGQLF
jgi:hypothetical protein